MTRAASTSIPRAIVPVRVRPRFEGGAGRGARRVRDSVRQRRDAGRRQRVQRLARRRPRRVPRPCGGAVTRRRGRPAPAGHRAAARLAARVAAARHRRRAHHRRGGHPADLAEPSPASRSTGPGCRTTWRSRRRTAPAWTMPRLFFASPLHFLASSLLVGGLVGLASSALDTWRLARRGAVRAADVITGLVGALSRRADRRWHRRGRAGHRLCRLHSRRGGGRAGRHPPLRPAALGLDPPRPADRRRRHERRGGDRWGSCATRSALLPWAMGSLRPSGRRRDGRGAGWRRRCCSSEPGGRSRWTRAVAGVPGG